MPFDTRDASRNKAAPLDLRLVAGNSNRPLAEAIAGILKLPLSKSVVRRFADMEVFVEVQENMRGEDVYVLQSTSFPANDNLMELLILVDALKRSMARRITAVMPYFGYARQDRRPGPRTPISAKLVANLIERAGVDRVMTVDLHAGQIQGFFDIPTDNLFAAPVMVRDIQERYGTSNLVVVSPDVGGVVRARGLAKRINVPIAICDKRRERPGESEVMNVIGDVKGKRAILIDDIVDSGGTLVNAANALLAQGATEAIAYISHGVLSGGAVAKITGSSLKTLVITDSIQATEAVKSAGQHPRAVDRAADGRGHRPHRARGERVEPVLLKLPAGIGQRVGPSLLTSGCGVCRLKADWWKWVLTHSGSSNSGRPWLSEHWPCRAPRAAGWVANAARFPVHFRDNQLQQSNSVGEGHALN